MPQVPATDLLAPSLAFDRVTTAPGLRFWARGTPIQKGSMANLPGAGWSRRPFIEAVVSSPVAPVSHPVRVGYRQCAGALAGGGGWWLWCLMAVVPGGS
jgi:hypothetical protein